MGVRDTANPHIPVAGDPIPDLSPEEHAALLVEGTAETLYDRHAARMAKQGHMIPKWGWISEPQRETWRTLARERIEQDATIGADVRDGLL